MWTLVSLLLLLACVTAGNYPVLDVATLMRMLLVPVDTKAGAAIYRLRGTDSDFDYPLQFDVIGSTGDPVIRIDTLPCSRNHSYCEANVLLAHTLELGRVYDLKLRLRDTRGDTTTVDCTIRPTNSSTPIDTIFPHLPTLILVPENTKVGAELDYVIARKNPKNTRHVNVELRGCPHFVIRQSLASSDTVNGTILLNAELDFEQQSMYTFNVFAVDAYTEPENDTRNLAGFPLAVAVLDVQDMPPVFTRAPPVTVLNGSFKEGDVVLTVHAEDGDKGSPREVRYGLVSDKNPFTSYFYIDPKTGNLSLSRPLKDLRKITQPQQPILLTIMADEVKTGIHEPDALSTTVQIALLMGELDNTPPAFENEHYVTWLDENSPQGTALLFDSITEIRDDDLGKNGVFAITLQNNNGTFEVHPASGEQKATFVIRVRNNSMLDYEQRHSLDFVIVARELGPGASLSSSATVTVYLNDVNDNPPVFRQDVYRTELWENAVDNTRVVQVEATDLDTGKFGEIRYTQIHNDNNHSLQIDGKTGWITVRTSKHVFDRESAAEFKFFVEAADMGGDSDGLRVTVPLIIKVLDVNDNPPIFTKQEYQFALAKNFSSLTTPAFVRATDADAESPNNVVRYEIASGNREDLFKMDRVTGELTVGNPEGVRRIRHAYQSQGKIEKFSLVVKAVDEAVRDPGLTVTTVTVFPPSSNVRNITFILNGYPVEYRPTEDMLSQVAGGRVIIMDVKPLPGTRARRDEWGSSSSNNKSVISARVLYDDNPTVDLTQLPQALGTQNTTVIVKKEKVEEYHRAESALFWILMILAILIVIIVLLLLLCCICPGCPLYVNPKKGKQVDHSDDSVHLVVKEHGPGMETKAVQAEWMGHRREAWSADQRQQRHPSWRFNRRNNPTKEHEDLSNGLDDRRLGYDIHGPAAASMGMRGHEDGHSLHSLPAQYHRVRDGPTVIYTRELQDLQRQADSRHHREIYLEDIEGNEYPSVGQIVDHRQGRGTVPHREVRINVEEDHDTDSMRRHEVERGSDLDRGSEYRRAEANRDVDGDDREYHFVLHRGNAQRVRHPDEDEEDAAELSTAVASRREQFYIRDGNAEILRLVTRGRSGDEQEFAQVGPQPQQRPMTLVAPRQQHHNVRVENGKEIIMQRFMEDQRNNSAQQGDTNREQEAQDNALLTSLHQQDMLVRRLLEEETRLNNTLLLTEALVAQRQHEQFLATAGEHIETQSLPGQTSMATQTDVDSSTQTEPMHLMRPPRRRARSDNDDSYTEEEDRDVGMLDEDANLTTSGVHGFLLKKHRSKRKRHSFHRGDLRLKRPGGKGGLTLPGKRHKIKTPIMEETESALEAAERQASANHEHVASANYTENKTSMLRRRNNKAKVTTTSGDMEVTSVPNLRQSDLHDDEEDTPTDSLEERSPSKRKYSSDDNRMVHFRRTPTPKRVSLSMGDVRSVNYDERWPSGKKLHVEFQDSSSSSRREISDKGRLRVSSYAASSDTTSGRPSEMESSTEVAERHVRPEFTAERARSSIHSSKSETGLNVLSSSKKVVSKDNTDDVSRSRRHSLSEPSRNEDELDLSKKQTVASRAKSLNQVNNVGKNAETKRGSRYMEWYKTKKEERERRKREEEEAAKKDKQKKRHKSGRIGTDTKSARSLEKRKRGYVTDDGGAKNSREMEVQRELDKAEEQVLKVTVFDDDMDSGIAMSSMLMGGGKKKRSQQLLEKKSVFTIAYDDMQTKQIRPDSSSPQY